MELMDAVKIECDRQQVGVERHQPLANAWQHARRQAQMGAPLTIPTLLKLADTAEPDNRGLIRTVPVTFQNGGTAASPQIAFQLVHSLVAHYWQTAFDEKGDVARDWLKQFLWIHPFIDGNGRVAWVLQQWLFETWDDPQPLIDFGW